MFNFRGICLSIMRSRTTLITKMYFRILKRYYKEELIHIVLHSLISYSDYKVTAIEKSPDLLKLQFKNLFRNLTTHETRLKERRKWLEQNSKEDLIAKMEPSSIPNDEDDHGEANLLVKNLKIFQTKEGKKFLKNKKK